MFHRVKSEGTQSPSSSSKPSADESKTVDAPTANSSDSNDAAKPQTPEAKSETPPAADIQTQPQSTSQSQLKDTQTMNDDKTMTDTPAAATTATGTFQRPTQPSRGGYPGSSYPGAGASMGSDASTSDRRLTIGPGITMSGEIESCDYLLVEGTVEAALKGANLLEIAESGIFYGTVEISEANISGRFEGDITVNGRLTITSTGTVTGSISYKEIEIEAGAVIDGKLTPLSATAAAAKPAPAKKPQAAKPAAATKTPEKQPEPANSDGELFSKTAAAAE